MATIIKNINNSGQYAERDINNNNAKTVNIDHVGQYLEQGDVKGNSQRTCHTCWKNPAPNEFVEPKCIHCYEEEYGQLISDALRSVNRRVNQKFGGYAVVVALVALGLIWLTKPLMLYYKISGSTLSGFAFSMSPALLIGLVMIGVLPLVKCYSQKLENEVIEQINEEFTIELIEEY